MPGMRTLARCLPIILLVPVVTSKAQFSPAAQQLSPIEAATGVSFDILSDTKGTQLTSYLGTLGPKLQQAFLGDLSAADAKNNAHQQVDLLMTIGPAGKLSGLHLAPGTQESPVAKAAWIAARDLQFASLPNSLHTASLTLRVHLVIA